MKLSECKCNRVYLDSISSSIELMDDFVSNEYDFLILDPGSRFSFVVSREIDDWKNVCGDLTMTQLRRDDWGWIRITRFSNDKIIREKEFSRGDTPQNLSQSLEEFEFEHENEKLKTDEIYQLKHPVLLRAQTSSDRDFYCWGGTKYGDTTSFYINGIVANW